MKLFISQATRKTQTFLALCAVAILIPSTFVLLGFRTLYSPIPELQEAVIFEIDQGSSLSRVAGELQENGYLRFPQLWVTMARWRGVAGAIKTGEYEMLPGLTPVELLEKMVRGDNIQYRITLVEGWTFDQAIAAIRESKKLRIELENRSRRDIAQSLQLATEDPEGMLFPDTYFYTKGTSDLELLRRANLRLQEVLATAWQSRLGALPYEDVYQALIMASIIEKESAVGSERGHIAGVFIRRLEQGMRLQSDPTVIYGLGKEYTGNLTRAELGLETPYNTYRIGGLPPTPIALAGRQSIEASLNPLSSDYLYFVARGDGSHYFSGSLEEHNAAVNRYQRQQDPQ